MEKNLKMIVALVLATGISMFFAPSEAFAKKECFTQYGGGETCINVEEDSDIEVDKEIFNPKTEQFEDHINPKSSEGYKFRSGENITFKIVVKNTGETDLEDIKLEDILPSYVRFNKYVTGEGSSDKGDSTVNFDRFNLGVGERKSFVFIARVGYDGIRPSVSDICITNIAKVSGKIDGDDDKERAVDYANFCIEINKSKSKENPKHLPVTGSSEVLYAGLSIASIAAGYALKRRVNK